MKDRDKFIDRFNQDLKIMKEKNESDQTINERKKALEESNDIVSQIINKYFKIMIQM